MKGKRLNRTPETNSFPIGLESFWIPPMEVSVKMKLTKGIQVVQFEPHFYKGKLEPYFKQTG